MLSAWRRQRYRTRRLDLQLGQLRRHQAGLGAGLLRRGREWAGEVETLAWFSATGFLWFSRVQRNRRADRGAAPLRELVSTLWLVLGWRQLPQRVQAWVPEVYDSDRRADPRQ